MTIEAQDGGFSAIYPVLREMEEMGRVRRGHFWLGMTSAQLAIPGAVDRLRSLRSPDKKSPAVLLAATDPAQPYGVLLEWPEVCHDGARPRRAVGTAVVLVDGRPGLFVDHGGRRLRTFKAETTEEGDLRFERALRALASDGARLGRPHLCIEEIDGEKARSSRFADAFVSAGFRVGYRGFEMDQPLGRGGVPIENDALGAHEEGGRD